MELIEDDSNEKTNFLIRFWRRRTNLQKASIISVTILLVVIVITAIILLSKTSKTPDEPIQKEETPCLTESCALARRMDPSVDPCGDFYAYACNGWIRSNPVPDGRPFWDTRTKLREQNQQALRRALEQPIEHFKSEAERKAKWYYESCMDRNSTEELGAKPMLEVVKFLGGWSFSRGFDAKKWSFRNILQVVHNRYSVPAFFSYRVAEDEKKASGYVLHVGQYWAILERKYFMNKEILEGYLEYMTKIGLLLGEERQAVNRQMKKVLDFESRMANISHESSNYSRLTLEQLNRTVKFMDWVAFFEDAQFVFSWRFNTHEEIEVHNLQHLKQLSQLIGEYLTTDEGRNILNDFLIWQTVRHRVWSLSKSFVEAQEDFYKLLENSSSIEEPQWKKCTELTDRFLTFATSAIFTREAVDAKSKPKFEEMVENINKTFKNNFKNLQWMDENVVERAKTKLAAMSLTIGYPKFTQNTTQLDDFYKDVSIKSNTFFDNNLSIKYNSVKKALKKINQTIDTSWDSYLIDDPIAYYDRDRNRIFISAGILRKPFFGSNSPRSLNYGSIGVLVGHELIHAFDQRGHQLNENGKFNPWWDYQTEEGFKSRTKCFKEKYGNGSEPVLAEIIADQGGIKIAYKAYLDVMEDEAEPEMLPDLPLNHRQLFFLAFAQIWCSSGKRGGEDLGYFLPEFHVNGALGNNEDFSREFGCKMGTRMNPAKKCEIWRWEKIEEEREEGL